MSSEKFAFKQFEVGHSRSSMKVGVDSILLGSWASTENVKKVLDVGTGCGLLALMCAQRFPEAIIQAIDIDSPSINEAADNFRNSPWSERLSAKLTDFNSLNEGDYDLIISNPPYFNSGIEEIVTNRERARHQDSLSPERLLEKGSGILSDGGLISMIVPTEQSHHLNESAKKFGLTLSRKTIIIGRPGLKSKRVLLEFIKHKDGQEVSPIEEELILEKKIKDPTDEFLRLCKDFYLHF